MKSVFEWQCFGNKEKRGRLFFCLAVWAAFVLIFIFNVLTPMMTDDLFYSKTVSEAASIWDLFAQEYTQYMTWTGRSVCHMILRFFLLTDKMVFNVANSVVFVLLTLLIYWNVEHKKKYDIAGLSPDQSASVDVRRGIPPDGAVGDGGLQLSLGIRHYHEFRHAVSLWTEAGERRWTGSRRRCAEAGRWTEASGAVDSISSGSRRTGRLVQ